MYSNRNWVGRTLRAAAAGLIVCLVPSAGMCAPTSRVDRDAANTEALASFPASTIFAVTTTNALIRFDASAPNAILGTVAIGGLQAGESILGIDFRPANGKLYGLGSTSRLYVINPATGAASVVGSGPFTPGLTGNVFGFDFDPVIDGARVVSDAEQNIRINPDTGVATLDSLLHPAGDIAGAAYSNNVAGTGSTALYDIDAGSDMLMSQSPPIDGVLAPVGALNFNTSGLAGFDIAPNGTAYASLTASGDTNSNLFTINLTTGAATLISNIGGGSTVRGIAVVAGAAVAGSDTAGIYVTSTGAWFLRNSNASGSADVVFTFGAGGGGLVPLRGDWNGDGIDTPGLYAPATGAFFLRNTSSNGGADLVFSFGAGGAGFVPLVGDWNGDGIDTVGLYAPSSSFFFLRNQNAGGVADLVVGFGPAGAGWAPIVGDWDGDGTDTVGLYAPSTSFFFLRNQNAGGAADLTFGFGPAATGWTPVAGDYDGNGTDTVGLYNPASALFFLRNQNASGAADLTFGYGPANATPLLGDWNGL